MKRALAEVLIVGAGEGNALDVSISREKTTPDSNARTKTLNQNQTEGRHVGGGDYWVGFGASVVSIINGGPAR